ncbi:MAG TPA: glycoside hydrolase family 3 N-terminal domain-containing protein [Solirubrobacterales bacterium]|nr:glycoside hydrolase family 3 N-terminal domain-containing protein [Solirubrobacterales bacterium]
MPVPSLRFALWRFAVVLALILAGGAVWFFLFRDDSESSEPEKEERGEAAREPVSDDPVVRKMSLDEQINEVLMLGFEGATPGAPGVEELAGDEVGAVLVRTENWTGSDAGKKLVAALKAGEGIPPLVAASQEGGEFRSFPDLPPEARALDIAREKKPDTAATAWAKAGADALSVAGFDLNLFPVADVATLDSPFAGRAFSDDPSQVASLTKAALKGCDEADIACAPLHFPGLGSASQDTAQGPATVATDLATLTARDLVPFEAVSRKAPAMVLSLGLYPDFDAVMPGALTPGVATDLLRRDVGFRGVAISDDLGAGAVTATYSVPEAAVRALAAGIDLIQVADPEDAEGVAKAIETAVEAGEIEPERLAQAAARVIELKRKLGLIDD